MYRRWTTIVALLTLVFAPAVLAQGDLKTYGTVTAKDATTLTIRTDEGQTVRFRINEHSLLPRELSVGDEVAVHHRASLGDDNLQPITEVLIADQLGDGFDDDRALPQTASPLAALALIGLAAVGGAAGLRRWRS